MSSDPSKCSYHILYAPALLIDHYELKALTELVYTLTGEKFGKYIDRGLPGQNFNLRLIGLAKKGHVKRILQFSLDNGWNELEHAIVQPPTSLGLEVRPRMLSVEKNNNPLRISVSQGILQKCADLVLQKHSKYLRDWTIEEKDSKNFVYFNRKASLECPLCKRIHDKDQWWFGRICASSGMFIVKCFRQNSDERGEVKYNEALTATETNKEKYVRPLPNEGDIYEGKTFRLAPNKETILAELWDWAKQMSLLPFENRTSASLICHLRKDVQGIIHALKTDFLELRIKEYHGKSDPVEKAHDFSNVEES
ncbi:hypothetical protein C1646_677267 [Rhizophagus diaphanus]|nr:hypothetical protein C1646_677267 [Rhizophagus diaphanus] [Rhizophagus sp. MUCL 43196]